MILFPVVFASTRKSLLVDPFCPREGTSRWMIPIMTPGFLDIGSGIAPAFLFSAKALVDLHYMCVIHSTYLGDH